jgi:hypothetical protein
LRGKGKHHVEGGGDEVERIGWQPPIISILDNKKLVDLWRSPLKWESILENPFSYLFSFLE